MIDDLFGSVAIGFTNTDEILLECKLCKWKRTIGYEPTMSEAADACQQHWIEAHLLKR